MTQHRPTVPAIPRGIYEPPCPEEVVARVTGSRVLIGRRHLRRVAAPVELTFRRVPARATSEGVTGYRYRRVGRVELSPVPLGLGEGRAH